MEVLGEEVFRPFSTVFHRVIDSQQSDGIEFRIDSNDGERWFYARVLPVARRHGQPPSVSLLTHDITAQKKTEEKFRKSEALLAQAEQLVNMGSWEIEPQLQTFFVPIICTASSVLIPRDREINYAKCRSSPNVLRKISAMGQSLRELAIEGKILFEHDFRYTSPDGASTATFTLVGFRCTTRKDASSVLLESPKMLLTN